MDQQLTIPMEIKAGRNKIKITSPDKVLFPKDGITKQQLVEYYAEITPYMLPHLKNRPVTLQRYPQGIEEDGFFQKEASEHFPDFIKRVPVKLKSGEQKEYIRIENQASLLYLVNHNSIVMHPWLSKKGKLNHPDMLIWDLDPTDGDFEKARSAARILFRRLQSLKLRPWLKTTGSRGLHVALALEPTKQFGEVRKYARHMAEILTKEYPDLLTVNMDIDSRGDKVFVDYLRNGFAQTAVAPFSVRAKEGAPVAMPVSWEMLDEKKFDSSMFNIFNASDYLASEGDAWDTMHDHAHKWSDLKV